MMSGTCNGIDWRELEDDDIIDPLDLDELSELPIKTKKKALEDKTKWILQYKDKHYHFPIKLPNVGYYIYWIMKWRESLGLVNENFIWIKCSDDENIIFDYKIKKSGPRSIETFMKKRFLVKDFMEDVFYRRVRPLPEKVTIGRKRKRNRREKNFFAKVGNEKISLGEKRKIDIYKPCLVFAENSYVEIFFIEDGKEFFMKDYRFNEYHRSARSERIYNSGREVIELINDSLQRQNLLRS